jgi:hypothetical protein
MIMSLEIVGYALFLGAFLGSWSYLRRTGRATPARTAALFVVSAAIFLVVPGFIAAGTDREAIRVAAVATAMSILPPVIIIFALRK